MARFDVYQPPAGPGYIIDVQADTLDVIGSRVIVPLLPVDIAGPAMTRLNPVFDIGEAPHVLQPQLIGAVRASALKSPVANLGAQSERITAALDMLFFGF